MILFIGFSMASRAFVGYVWMTENMRVKDVSKCTALVLTVDSLCISIAALYFQYVSKDWQYLFIVPVVFLAINYAVFWRHEESPKFLHAVGKYDEAREVLTNIGRSNGILQSD